MLINQQEDKIVLKGDGTITFVRNMNSCIEGVEINAPNMGEWQLRLATAGIRYGILNPQPAWYRPLHISGFYFVAVTGRFVGRLRACWTLWKWSRAALDGC